MPTRDDNAGLTGLLCAAAQDLSIDFRRQFRDESGHIQRQEGLPAHRVNIRNTVGRCNAAKVVRVVHHRREKVGRHHQGTP